MTKMRTGIISYNIANRGRKYVGQPRNYNVPAVVDVVNSGVVQELVAKGDLFGYLGHGVREEFGLFPEETVLSKVGDNNELTPIDPCCRTISIKAHADGTIEHEAEFIDNLVGRKAFEWFSNKIGGFSSVFAPDPENPTMFYGFDYVRMPNFDGNRGYVADSAMINIDPMRLTARQQALLMTERLEERKVVMDSIANKLMSAKHEAFAEKALNQQLLSDFETLQAAYDNAQFQMRDMAFLLSQSTPAKHEPMLTLNPSNWLTDNSGQSVMDSIGNLMSSESVMVKPFEQDLLGSIFNYGK